MWHAVRWQCAQIFCRFVICWADEVLVQYEEYLHIWCQTLWFQCFNTPSIPKRLSSPQNENIIKFHFYEEKFKLFLINIKRTRWYLVTSGKRLWIFLKRCIIFKSSFCILWSGQVMFIFICTHLFYRLLGLSLVFNLCFSFWLVVTSVLSRSYSSLNARFFLSVSFWVHIVKGT